MESTKKHRNKTTERRETLVLAKIEKEALFSPLFSCPFFSPFFFVFCFNESLNNSRKCSLSKKEDAKKRKKNLLFFRLFFPYKKRVFKEKALIEGKDAPKRRVV